MSDRHTFLQRVREAVAEGNRAGATPPLPERGAVGYQGAGADPVERWRGELVAAGGIFHPALDLPAARQRVLDIVRDRQARRILLGRGPLLDALDLGPVLAGLGAQVLRADADADDLTRDALFAADLGLSEASHLIAETGTVVVAAAPREPRSLTLLPPVHIVVADRPQLLPDLFDLFDLLERLAAEQSSLPSCLTLITGPSKTGDIELRLVTGVHGPGELHVVLVGS